MAGAVVGAQPAWAEVRKSDVVLGQTIEERGLSAMQCPDISAERALVIDDTGKIYFERNADEQTNIASITKIMTAIVALENVPLDYEIVVTEAAAEVGESSAGLREGYRMTLLDALYGLLIPSGNDASLAIADAVGRVLLQNGATADTPTIAFVNAMNDKAAALGMANTRFDNPHGLDFGAYGGEMYSTARDVATMAAYAMHNETFREIVATGSTSITVQREGDAVEVALESTDILVGSYEGACGIKTGHTDAAGYCFAGACSRDSRTLYAIVLGSPDSATRFNDTEALFDWVYDHEVTYRFINTDQTVTVEGEGGSNEMPLVAEVAHQGWIDARIKATVADPNISQTICDLDGNISQTFEFNNVESDVRAGDKLGTITFTQRNRVIATVDIIAAEDYKAPNLFEGVGVWWDRLFRGFSGEQQVAESVGLNEVPLVSDKTSRAR